MSAAVDAGGSGAAGAATGERAQGRPAPADPAAFIARLQGFKEDEDRGALAALRRGLGKPPGEAAETYPYVVPWVPDGASRREEACYYLVAALFAWHPENWVRGDGKTPTNFGASFARLRSVTDSESAERTMVALLNSHHDDLPERLRRAVGLLRSHDVRVDWAQLLRDLRAWDALDRRVQRNWARAFWGSAPEQETAGGAAAGGGEPAEPATGEPPSE